MPPLKAVRDFCLSCIDGEAEVRRCTADGSGGYDPCPLHPYRMGTNPEAGPTLKLSILRGFCLWCMGGQRDLVGKCTSAPCALHPYRMGHNPAMKNRPGRSREELAVASTIARKKRLQDRQSDED